MIARPAFFTTVVLAFAFLAVSCVASDEPTVGAGAEPNLAVGAAEGSETSTDQPATDTTDGAKTDSTVLGTAETTVETTSSVEGKVTTAEGIPLAAATVTVGTSKTITADDGAFLLTDVPAGSEITITRPAWQSTTVTVSDESDEPLIVELEPAIVRALRASRIAVADRGKFQTLLDLADETPVNALVFDTKDETDTVLYVTNVAFATKIGAVDAVYDPEALLAEAKEHELYTITRIVTFEDPTWAEAAPEAKLSGAWVDAGNKANWEYPLDLAVEACQLGFDEVQFDYVRFPSGQTALNAWELVPQTQEQRTAVIAGFLGEAQARLHPLGCGVSAAIFGITMSSATDERIGQTPEAISRSVDVVSPMLYPSHYSPGWLGHADPNDHPGPVIAHALEVGMPRIEGGSLVRPWIQGFFYRADAIQAQIREAESRGAGWIIWNASGSYDRSWLVAQ